MKRRRIEPFGTHPPPMGWGIDYTHPLAQDLLYCLPMQEGDGRFLHSAKNRNLRHDIESEFLKTAAYWQSAGAMGKGYGNSGGVGFITPDVAVLNDSAESWAYRVNLSGFVLIQYYSPASARNILMVGNLEEVNPTLQINTNADDTIDFIGDDADPVISNMALQDGHIYALGASFIQNEGSAPRTRDGICCIRDYTSGDEEWLFAPAATGTHNDTGGNLRLRNVHVNWLYFAAYAWKRSLHEGEFRQLMNSPYAFLNSRGR